VVLHSKNLTPI